MQSENEKYVLAKSNATIIGSFIEWLEEEKNVVLCTKREEEGRRRTVTTFEPMPALLKKFVYEFFEVDLDKVDKEKEQMLEEIRKKNENHQKENSSERSK